MSKLFKTKPLPWIIGPFAIRRIYGGANGLRFEIAGLLGLEIYTKPRYPWWPSIGRTITYNGRQDGLLMADLVCGFFVVSCRGTIKE